MAGRRRWLLVIGANLLATCLLLEIALRVQEPWAGLMSWGYYSSPNYRYAVIDHPVWDHQLRPDLPGLRLRVGRPVRAEEFSFTLRTNSLGCRGEEPVVPRPPDRYRIVVMGDSFTEGYHEEDTVARRLEHVLDARGAAVDFEVMNCSASSYSMLPTLLRLREQLLPIAPDAVIVNVDLTDLYDDYWRRRPDLVTDAEGRPVAVGDPDAGEGPLRAALVRHAFLARALASYGKLAGDLLASWLEEAPRARVDPDQRRRHLVTGIERYLPHRRTPEAAEAFAQAWPFYAAQLDRLLALCAAHDLACAFSTYPHEAQLPAPDGAAAGAEPPPLHREFAQRIAAHLAARSVPFFDLHDAIAGAYARDPTIYFTGDMHFTPQGQRVFSDAFAAALAPWVMRAAGTGAPPRAADATSE